jgi:hypothetical protein
VNAPNWAKEAKVPSSSTIECSGEELAPMTKRMSAYLLRNHSMWFSFGDFPNLGEYRSKRRLGELDSRMNAFRFRRLILIITREKLQVIDAELEFVILPECVKLSRFWLAIKI